MAEPFLFLEGEFQFFEEETTATQLLAEFAEIADIPVDELIPREVGEAPSEFEFETYPVYEEPTEDRPLDLNNPDGADTDEYFDVLFESIDVDADSEIDQYSED